MNILFNITAIFGYISKHATENLLEKHYSEKTNRNAYNLRVTGSGPTHVLQNLLVTCISRKNKIRWILPFPDFPLKS